MDEQEYLQLQALLLPVLSDAIAGVYERDLPIPAEGSHDLNRILMGVQVLVEQVRAQGRELERSEAQVVMVQRQTSEILARVIDRL